MATKHHKKTKRIDPETLLDAIRNFGDPDVALAFLASLRWPDGEPGCPRCGDMDVRFIQTRRLWACRGCQKQFSVKVGTIFEDSPVSLTKWLPALWMVANCKNGISSYELARALGVTQKTAWFMTHRIRLAMQSGSFVKFRGHIEADETFIGGKARNMSTKRRAKKGLRKVAVMGLLERHGTDKPSQAKAVMVPNVRRHKLETEIVESVEFGAAIYTDKLASYDQLHGPYVHRVINHAETYAMGQVHTNGLENFWSLLKRALKGTYVSVEPFHLFRYLDEQVYKFNNRLGTDAERFIGLCRAVVDRRVTYAELTGASTTPA